MANDELVWHVIGHQFCCFRAKVADNERDFCRNEHNVTGLCDRRSCPLANSRYATVKEENGKAVLYMKTVERAHMPNRLWEKIVLPQNYTQALALIDQELAYWPKFLKHKNKQRLTKIHQLLIRMRKLRKENAPRMERVNQKDERREKKREAKALDAAKLELSIEKELLERLKQGTYGDIYNYPTAAYENALKEANAEFEDNQSEDAEEEEATRVEFVEGDISEDEDDMEDWYNGEEVGEDDEDDQTADSEEDEDDDNKPITKQPVKKVRTESSAAPKKPAPKAPANRRGPYVEIEYEHEQEAAETAKSSVEW